MCEGLCPFLRFCPATPAPAQKLARDNWLASRWLWRCASILWGMWGSEGYACKRVSPAGAGVRGPCGEVDRRGQNETPRTRRRLASSGDTGCQRSKPSGEQTAQALRRGLSTRHQNGPSLGGWCVGGNTRPDEGGRTCDSSQVARSIKHTWVRFRQVLKGLACGVSFDTKLDRRVGGQPGCRGLRPPRRMPQSGKAGFGSLPSRHASSHG
jgi:hypothetical protein